MWCNNIHNSNQYHKLAFNASIFNKEYAASSPLFPFLPPHLSNACESELVVKTPKITGLLNLIETLSRPLDTALDIYLS